MTICCYTASKLATWKESVLLLQSYAAAFFAEIIYTISGGYKHF